MCSRQSSNIFVDITASEFTTVSCEEYYARNDNIILTTHVVPIHYVVTCFTMLAFKY